MKLILALFTAFITSSAMAAEPAKPAEPAAEKPAQKPAPKKTDCSKPENQQKKSCKQIVIKTDCAQPENLQKEACKKNTSPVITPASGVAPTPTPIPSPVTPAACDSVSSTLSNAEGVQLASASGCTGCHKIGAAGGYGPDWKEVATRYRCEGKVGQIAIGVEARLINKIAHGGTGTWGHNAMPANSPRVSDANIKKLADFVLTLP